MVSKLVLEPNTLDAIAQSVRDCFLAEEVNEYLSILQQGIDRLIAGDFAEELTPEYAVLIRAAHSLKGGAGMAQLPRLSRFAHQIEEILQALQHHCIGDQHVAGELLLSSLAQMSHLIARATSLTDPAATAAMIETSKSESLKALDRLIAKLPCDREFEPKWLQHSDNVIVSPKGTHSISPAFIQKVLAVDLEKCLQRMEQLLAEAADAEILHQEIATLTEECTLLGEVLNLVWLKETAILIAQSLKELERSKSEKNPPSLADLARSAIAEIRQQRAQTLTLPSVETTPPINTPPPAIHGDIREVQSQIPPQFLKYVAVNSPQHQAPTNLNLRVPSEKLDRMSQSLEELRFCYEQFARHQSQLPLSFQTTLKQFGTSLEHLHTDLNESRLGHFSQLSDRFRPFLQTLQQRHGKAVELIVTGGEIELEQGILEQLQTPLIHLVRNAFDHGIETSAERASAQKPTVAKIELSAKLQGTQIAIAIADDGRGIDLQKVYQRAIQLGLINSAKLAEENLSSDRSIPHFEKAEMLQFLFAPGFSTAGSVSDLSGRGVGLDIVCHQIARLGGSMQVETRFGQGTKFTITLPLSDFAMALCRCGERTLAIPAGSILATLPVGRDAVTKGKIHWRDRDLPIFSLQALLPYPETAIATVSTPAQECVGLVLDIPMPMVVVIDQILAQRLLRLSPLDPLVPVPAYLAGCTTLATGEVVPVLSPSHLHNLIPSPCDLFGQFSSLYDHRSDLAQSFTATQPTQLPTVLIVDDSKTVRQGLTQLFTRIGFRVISCRDGAEALAKLNSAVCPFHLIVSDIEMPRLNGLELLQQIRTHPQWHHLPVVILTSQNHSLWRKRALHLGANAYLTKPWKPAALLDAIAQLQLVC